MARQTETRIRTEADLIAADDTVDRVTCGISLACRETTRFQAQGAHDPTPTPYFVLEKLFGYFSFDSRSHLLDVGCSTGRVLAHFLRGGFSGRATGVELDPELAEVAQSWTALYANLQVIQGSVLDIGLSGFTDFYLFNPFDSSILSKLIQHIEEQVVQPVTVIHMSDNGEVWWYLGRPGWTEVASGTFQDFKNARGFPVRIYDDPQHWTAWRFDPAQATGHLT